MKKLKTETKKLFESGNVYCAECPLLYAVKIIGGKWKLPILWQLFDAHVVRYNELQRSLVGITSMMLSKSLKELEGNGLIERIQYDCIPPKVEYKLSERGRALEPSLRQLKKWGKEQLTYEQQHALISSGITKKE